MEIHGLPPASAGGMRPLGPEDQTLIDGYKALFSAFTEAWGSGDEAKVKDALTNLLQFMQQNKQGLEQLCNTNGWSPYGAVGYTQNIEGSINNISLLLQNMPPLNSPQFQLLDETLTSVRSMLTTHA